ncbi:hypothetical protein RRG08_029558 [Elysia crispata]|uniref:Uncharacterized protein n=1 Tax=Elysia crispata TaxID=231223 RepID=A0AAE0YSN9_9GAST|nr:hypothetical protein RRG08_029558 [Elysia crispata]
MCVTVVRERAKQAVNQGTQKPSVIKNAQKVTMVKNVQRHAVTTVLEIDISVIMSLVLVTWVVIQDIRAIYVHKSALMVSMAMDVRYQGSSCIKFCPRGRYGHGCTETCSKNCAGADSACNHVDGSCDQGCDLGYLPPVCNVSK